LSGGVTVSDELQRVRLLLLDVDGVLTDGAIVYDDSGAQTKVFDVRDGMGIRLLVTAGIAVGIVTGRRSEALVHRCRDLGIDLLFDGVADKASVLEAALRRTGLPARQVAFVGDDLPDLPLMRRVGVAIAVADAHETVRERALLVTRAAGGHGAVREICEQILKSQGLWEAAVSRFET
jgi:3-deoxy-D-manno-octulosonate 8-phosphate phosphatase (KDO 8-P phosphatase)